MGGSTEIGAAGYARAYLEMLEQLDREGVAADWVIHASSTGGTQAGLLAGRALAGRGPRVFGVDVAKGGPALRETVTGLANNTLRRLGATLRVPDSEVITSDFTGDAYGEVTAEGRLAIRLALQTEGLVLDPVYSAKALGAIPTLAEGGALQGTAAVVFLHTGGQPALFAAEYSRAVRAES
jgi:1-aminocyclopropane-1-carboxylate deaminase/D-cysteine desulfhydrase-like pyridoxal-dependent ACC family enzyme